MTKEEIEAAIDDVKNLASLAKPFFARSAAADPDLETRIELYKDIDTTDDEVEQLMVKASNGITFAKSLLFVLALVRLSKSDKPLDRWTFSLLKEQKRKGARGRRPRPQNWKSFVSYLVARVHERHPELKRTKGHETKTKASVCWIVSEGLSRAGEPLSETRVEEIFKEQQKSRLPEHND